MNKIVIYLFLSTLISLSCMQNNEEGKGKGKGVTETPISNIKDNTITNLYDAFGKDIKGLTKDFGFSALVNYNGKLILFDAGTNAEILKSNVESLGIDLKDVDFAVGSHAHGDHLNGFDYLLEVNPEVKIYLPFDLFAGANIGFNIEGRDVSIKDSLPKEMQYFGYEKDDLNITINQSGRFWKANVEYVKDNTEIEPGIRLIATRSPYLGYGSKYPSVAELGGFKPSDTPKNDNIKFVGLPELSLSLSTPNGEVILVGCSHSSVQKIIKDTKTYTNNPINLVYGGYHMLPYGKEEIAFIATKLKDSLRVKYLAPTHCTGHIAFKLLKDTFKENYLFAGLGEQIDIP